MPSSRRTYRHITRWVFLGSLAATAHGAVDKDLSYCHNEPNSLVSDACVSYATLENINTEIRPALQYITNHVDFFTYYRLDLYGRECPFWSDDTGLCGNRACAVDLTDEKDIPIPWRAAELGKLEGPKATQPKTEVQKEEPSPFQGKLGEQTAESCIFEPTEKDNRDFCVREDEANGKNCVYVSLVDNPERFTGYAGTSANNVWRAVYQENCFNSQAAAAGQSTVNSPFGGSGAFANAGVAAGLKGVMDRKKHEIVKKGVMVQQPVEEQCLEKRVFYKVISGMHASISMHLCWDFLNQTTGQWGPNFQCYKDRLHAFPDRIQNIYFNYAILLRAMSKIRKHLPAYSFCSGDRQTNDFTQKKISALSESIASHPSVFDETMMFRDQDSIVLKEDFRTRFRNVSRLMDCVGCDKCRLWGKVQTSGYGTALKILFEYDEDPSVAVDGKELPPPLRRTELVALVNTLGRLSNSLYAFTKFSAMIEQERLEEEAKKHEEGLEEEMRKEQERIDELARQNAVEEAKQLKMRKAAEERQRILREEDEEKQRKIKEQEEKANQAKEDEIWASLEDEQAVTTSMPVVAEPKQQASAVTPKEPLEEEKDEAPVEEEDDIMRYPDFPELTGQESVRELISIEMRKVWFALQFIAKSWYDLPLKLWRIYKWANMVLVDKFLGHDRYQTRKFPYKHALDEL